MCLSVRPACTFYYALGVALGSGTVKGEKKKNRVRTLETELERVQLALLSQTRLSADSEPVGTALSPDSRDGAYGI